LDFPHAAEHVSVLIQGIQQAGINLPTDLLERILHRLKKHGPRLLMRLLDRLPTHVANRDGVREQISYLRKREALMQYPEYQHNGWPIGSGIGESANKLVVQSRLKGAGMHWEASHVNPMLSLRNAVCNDRWEETRQEIVTEKGRQQQMQRQQRALARYQQRVASLLLLLLPFLPPPPKSPPAPLLPASPAATLPGSSRPSSHHPWKRGPACFPKSDAKI
jgi:hypothetical protein